MALNFLSGFLRDAAGFVAVNPRGFVPSAYSAVKSATTTVTGQSEAVPIGAAKYRVRNLDGTNYGLFAFGTSAANAETNAANGIAIGPGGFEYFGVPVGATHIAWLGDTATVSLSITAGV